MKRNFNFKWQKLLWYKYKLSPPTLVNASLYVDYIYLDTEERRTFAQQKHEYLIEQLQYNGQEILSTQTNKIKLNFNHPIKELVWVIQPISNIDLTYTNDLGGPQFFNFTQPQTRDQLKETYKDKIETIQNMGFDNEELILKTLSQSHGSVVISINKLLS